MATELHSGRSDEEQTRQQRSPGACVLDIATSAKPRKERFISASIALASDVFPAAKSIARKIRQLFPKFDPATALTDDETCARFTFNGTAIVITRVAEPLTFDPNDAPTIKKPLTARTIESHQAHWVISAYDEDRALAAIAATITAAAVVECCSETVAVFWPAAHHWIAPNTFVEHALRHVESRPPVELWINCSVQPSEARRHAAFTRGMKAFGYKEFEVLDSPESARSLRNRLEGLCAYVIKDGAVIHDSDTVGHNRTERIPILLCRSAHGLHETVLRLDYENYIAPRPWWKLI